MAELDAVAEAHQAVELAVGLRVGAQPLRHAQPLAEAVGSAAATASSSCAPGVSCVSPTGEQLAQRADRGQRIGQDRASRSAAPASARGRPRPGPADCRGIPQQASPGVRAQQPAGDLGEQLGRIEVIKRADY